MFFFSFVTTVELSTAVISHEHSFMDQLILTTHKRHAGNYIPLPEQTDKVSYLDIYRPNFVFKLT